MKHLLAMFTLALTFNAAAQTPNFDAQWNRNTARATDQYVETMYYDFAQHKSKQ